MKILLINKFLYPKGGDAICTLTTGDILKQNDHSVCFWGMAHPDNPDYPFKKHFVPQIDYENSRGLLTKMKTAANILYSLQSKKNLCAMLKNFHPDLIHLNNFAHQISPSILDVIKAHRIPTVMTMHDYKMVCPAYKLLCKNEICEKCREGRYYHCFLNRCTKDSAFKSMVNVAEMYLHHNLLRIYDKIDIYISPSRFLKKKVVEMGLSGEIAYLPNCVDLSKFEHRPHCQENSIVYVGRLSHEKGVETLMDAVKGIDVKLKIIGDGPLSGYLREKRVREGIQNVIFLGYRDSQRLHDEIRSSMFLVIPSEWYENNPMSVIEAFALGKPVAGSRIGGIPELVQDGKTGITFSPGNVTDLHNKILFMLKNEQKLEEMGQAARKLVEQKFNTTVYYDCLMKIYEHAKMVATIRKQ
jgi:glycosyltransferase involved in cell wall biosynthesis